MYPVAPRRVASIALSTPPWAVIMITGRSRSLSRSARSALSPSITGIFRSIRMSAGACSRTASSASLPFCTAMVR